MEMHQLRYVVAVARTGNFSRAAEQCHVAQPSLSQQVQKLEEELGERLFDRRQREARLTAAGESFLPRALRILEEVELARREATEATELHRGTLTIGVLPTLAPYLLPEVLVAFTSRYPGVDIVVQEDMTSRLLEWVRAYEVDFALASHPIRDERLEVRELFTEDLLLALPAGHALSKRAALRAADLDGQRFIVMKEGHCLGDQVLGFCERQDVTPAISFRSSQLETVQALVASGLGLALVPAMATRPGHPPSVEFRAMQAPRPNRRIVAVWPRQRPPSRSAREFLRLVEERFAPASVASGSAQKGVAAPRQKRPARKR